MEHQASLERSFAHRADVDVSQTTEPEAHLFAFDCEQAGLAWAEHADSATAANPHLFESVDVGGFASQFDDDPFAFGREKLYGDGHCGGTDHGNSSGGTFYPWWIGNQS
jgi:hypothetical protein